MSGQDGKNCVPIGQDVTHPRDMAVGVPGNGVPAHDRQAISFKSVAPALWLLAIEEYPCAEMGNRGT